LLLSPLYVAAAAPAFVASTILDENVEPINLDAEADIVGISFMTFNAPRAYEIARAFRQRGLKVIFGGHHPTLMPDEAIRHCDAVCIGEAEPNVPNMMSDFVNGELKPFYSLTSNEFHGRALDRRLIQKRHYITTNGVQATRGCTNRCEFCSISAFVQRTFKTRPVDEVLAEIKTLPGRHVLFIDDNITANVHYAKELFRRLIPLKRHWYGQAA